MAEEIDSTINGTSILLFSTHNYKEWSFRAKAVLIINNLWDYVNPESYSYNENTNAWAFETPPPAQILGENHVRAHAMLTLMVTYDVLSGLQRNGVIYKEGLEQKDAPGLWVSLERKYGGN